MGRYTWGKAVTGVVLTASLAAVSGCGGNAEAKDKKPAAAAPSFAKAAKDFQDVAANAYLDDECTQEAGTCWDKMKGIVASARVLRKAMNGEKGVGPEFWSDAYVLIDKMEKGYAVGEDQGGGINNVTSNRAAIFGGAHDLSDWLDEHPVE
jgi:hypothetical protein